MPWNSRQNALFRLAAHNPEIAKEHGLSTETARRLASEGIKRKKNKLSEKAKK